MSNANYLLKTISFLCVISTVFSFRILGVFLYPSKSHEVLGTSLLSELAERGHEVTMISTFEKTSLPKNFTHVFVNATTITPKYSKYLMSLNRSLWDHTGFTNTHMKYLVSELLEDPKLKEFLETKQQFDVAISVLFSEALLGISHRVNASTISFHPFEGSSVDYLSGNPHPYSYVPNEFTGYTDVMTFWQRFINTYTHLLCETNRHFFSIPIQKSLLKQYFPEAPPLEELMSNVDIHLVNSHYLFEIPRPLLPNVIPIGGFHLQRPERLRGEFLKHLNESKTGVVLFTVGGHKSLDDFSKETIGILFKSFELSKFTFMVQYDGNKLVDVPKNVKLFSWLPQRAILSHANTKLFITHGGRSSTVEAIYYGVPMLELIVSKGALDGLNEKGYGLKLDVNALSVESLTEAIKEMGTNPVYKDAILQEAKLYRRQEMGPMDKAVYWIEYVGKYHGAKRLKSSVAIKIPRCKYLLTDVVLVTFILWILLAIATFFWTRWMYKRFVKKQQYEGEANKHKSV